MGMITFANMKVKDMHEPESAAKSIIVRTVVDEPDSDNAAVKAKQVPAPTQEPKQDQPGEASLEEQVKGLSTKAAVAIFVKEKTGKEVDLGLTRKDLNQAAIDALQN